MSQRGQIDFRRAEPSDVSRVLPLMADFYAYGSMAFDREIAATALAELLGDASLGELWLAEQDGAAIAYVVVAFGFSLELGGRDAFLDELYVAEAYRGAGIGKQALALAERICRERGARVLHLEVDETDERAQRFYAKAGYRSRLADTHNYLMTKRL